MKGRKENASTKKSVIEIPPLAPACKLLNLLCIHGVRCQVHCRTACEFCHTQNMLCYILSTPWVSCVSRGQGGEGVYLGIWAYGAGSLAGGRYFSAVCAGLGNQNTMRFWPQCQPLTQEKCSCGYNLAQPRVPGRG